jgi:tRNA modification GTPase
MALLSDTICAMATPAGRGGVSVIRISGPAAVPLCQALTGITPVPRQTHFTTFRDSAGDIIDSGLTLFFQAPHSFTGEDVCELQCHGSPIVVDLLLQQLTAAGARLAMPGEFSQRAFLNDKIDLTQAEAIADLIDSSSAAAARHAARSLQGDFSRLIQGFTADVVALRVYVEASMDFPEEEIDFLSTGNIEGKLQALITQLEQIQAQALQGSILREGLRVVIAGAPNAGKSTLMNALCGEDVAIVTPIAGTTRDMLRQDVNIDGIPVHIIDTAGLRDSQDPVEQEGIRRARQAVENADRVLLVVDSQRTHDYRQDVLWHDLASLSSKLSIVYNKTDLVGRAAVLNADTTPPTLFLSAHTGEGMPLLRQHLKACAGVNPADDGGFIARRRHLDALARAQTGLNAALGCLTNLRAGELVAEELRNVQLALDEITGRFTTDDLLGAIFSSFCIGK